MILCALHMLTVWCVHLIGAGLKQSIQQRTLHLTTYGVYKIVQSHPVPEMKCPLMWKRCAEVYEEVSSHECCSAHVSF